MSPTPKRARIGNHDECSEGKAADAPGAPDPDLEPFVELPFRGAHNKAVSSISFSPVNTARVLCATSSADGSARIWDIDEVVNGGASKNALSSEPPVQLQPKSVLYGHNGKGINDVAWSSSGEYAATASDDKTGRIWDVEKSTALIELKGHRNFVFTCRFNPRSSLIATGSFDETVKLWDVRTGDCVSTIVAHSNPVTAVDFNTDGTCIASGSYDGERKSCAFFYGTKHSFEGLVRIWDTATGECFKTVHAELNPPVASLKFSPNGRFLMAGTLDSKIRLYDVFHSQSSTDGSQPRGGKCAKTYQGGHKATRFCSFNAFLTANPERKCVVTGSEDGKICLYDLQRRNIVQVLEGHTEPVLALDAHHSIELIASGGIKEDRWVRFWMPGNLVVRDQDP